MLNRLSQHHPLVLASVKIFTGDRALQRAMAEVLNAIYEQDFLPCSFGGRPGRGAHHALATLNEIIVGKRVSWVLEAASPQQCEVPGAFPVKLLHGCMIPQKSRPSQENAQKYFDIPPQFSCCSENY